MIQFLQSDYIFLEKLAMYFVLQRMMDDPKIVKVYMSKCPSAFFLGLQLRMDDDHFA